MFEVRIPSLGESVTEATIARWAKQDGETVSPDDVLLEIESDKASTELPAERAGVLRIVKREGETVTPGDVVARIEDAAAGAGAPRGQPAAAPPPVAAAPSAPQAAPPPQAPSAPPRAEAPRPVAVVPAASKPVGPLSPAVRNLIAEHGLDPAAIPGSGKGGRLTKGDVLTHLDRRATLAKVVVPPPAARAPQPPAAPPRGRGRGGARPDEPHPQAHRGAAGRGTAYGGDPHHLQRDRLQRAAGSSAPSTRSASSRSTASVSDSCRSSAAPAWRRCRRFPPSTRRSTATTSSTSTSSTSAWRSGPSAVWWCRWCVTPHLHVVRRTWSARSAAWPGSRATASSPSTTCRAVRSPSRTAASTARCSPRRS